MGPIQFSSQNVDKFIGFFYNFRALTCRTIQITIRKPVAISIQFSIANICKYQYAILGNFQLKNAKCFDYFEQSQRFAKLTPFFSIAYSCI